MNISGDSRAGSMPSSWGSFLIAAARTPDQSKHSSNRRPGGWLYPSEEPQEGIVDVEALLTCLVRLH